jgi:2-isopropylmalate synthase
MTTENETATPVAAAPAPNHQRLQLARWSCTTGSAVQSRGVVIVESGDHRWQASAEGIGPVDALFKAVDVALNDVLSGQPRLVAYDVHALGEGTESEAAVRVRLAPPEAAGGARSEGTYEGDGQSANIIAASVEAYIDALNRLLAEAHWAGATDSAGNWRATRSADPERAEYDPAETRPDVTAWFER